MAKRPVPSALKQGLPAIRVGLLREDYSAELMRQLDERQRLIEEKLDLLLTHYGIAPGLFSWHQLSRKLAENRLGVCISDKARACSAE